MSPRVRLANEISVRAAAVKAGEPPRSQVWMNGTATGQSVDGAVLEAAVDCGGRYLLFMTDDVPAEDQLSIHLVDRDGRLLDTARIGGIYATGSFSSLRLHEPASVSFRFINGTDWTVEVFDGPRLRLPLVSEPRGVSRPLRLRCWFRVATHPLGPLSQ